ncbi:MAG: MATE family efflux transporter [Eubacteriales bacterium]|nr:MATE family efflux transporter [Eubacteriales bacterium]
MEQVKQKKERALVNPDRLGQDPVKSLIKELAMPAIVAQLINLLYNIVDRIYIGRIPETGSLALSGLGIAAPIILTLSAFSAFASFGGAPLASISLGAGDEKRAERLLQTNAGYSLLLGVLLTVLTTIYLEPLLYFFGAQESNLPYAASYLRIYLIGTTFVLGTLALNSFISAQGASRVAMRTVLIGAIANIILDPIFIFTLKLGVRGAAYATVLSQALSFITVLYFLLSKDTKLRLTGLRLDLKLFFESTKLGISGFTMIATQSAVATVFNRLLSVHGGELHVATMVILQSIIQMLFIPMNGYIGGVQPLLSYNYGAGNLQRVKEILQRSLILLCSFSFISAVTVALLPGLFAWVFTNDPELASLVRQYLPTFIIGMSIFGLQETAQMYFVGTNQALRSMFLATLRKIIILIPLCYILSARYSVYGVYLSEAIADASSASIAGLMFFSQYRKFKDLPDLELKTE